MSREQFDDNCPGCMPVVIDLKTHQPYSEDSPVGKSVAEFWKTTSLEERQAFHEFTCQNSRNPIIMDIVGALSEKMKKHLEGVL